MFDLPDPDPASAVVDGGPEDTWADRECPFDDDQDAPPLPEDVEFVPPSAGEWLATACGQAPGVGQLSSLVDVDVADLSADDAITALQEAQRAAAWLAGFETQLRARVTAKVVDEVQGILAADAVAGRPQYVAPEQVAWSEITAALRMSPVTGEARILEAEELTTTWRVMLDGMLAGSLTLEHVRAIGRQLRNLPGFGSADRRT